MKQPEISYRFSPDARADYFLILDYISNTLVNPDAADAFSDKLQKSIKLVQAFPELHPVEMRFKHEYRKMVVGSYLVFSVIFENEIVVARILNSRQNHKRILRKTDSLS